MRLTSKELALAKKALEYYDDGDPMKDAFDGGRSEEDELFAKCMKIAIAAQRKTP